MTANQSLPASLYLLAYNTRKNELATKAWLDYLVRGAVLCELIIGGYLIEVSSRPRAAANGRGARQPADPMLSWVLDELRGDTGLTWRRLLRQDAAQSLAAIEQRLAQQRLISAGPGGSVTGRVTAADPAAIESMQESVRAALTGQVDPAALAARTRLSPRWPPSCRCRPSYRGAKRAGMPLPSRRSVTGPPNRARPSGR